MPCKLFLLETWWSMLLCVGRWLVCCVACGLGRLREIKTLGLQAQSVIYRDAQVDTHPRPKQTAVQTVWSLTIHQSAHQSPSQVTTQRLVIRQQSIASTQGSKDKAHDKAHMSCTMHSTPRPKRTAVQTTRLKKKSRGHEKSRPILSKDNTHTSKLKPKEVLVIDNLQPRGAFLKTTSSHLKH